MNSAEERITDDGTALEGVGTQLKTAREARNLSIADVAHALKISPRQVELLEASAWSELPGHTFVRGFVRNYGRFLHLDSESLLKQLEAAPVPLPPQLNLPRSTEVALPQAGEGQRKDFLTMGLGAVLVLVAALAFFLVPDGWWHNDVTTIVHRNPEPAAQPALPSMQPAEHGLTAAPTEGTLFPPGSPEAAAAVSAAGAAPAAVAGAPAAAGGVAPAASSEPAQVMQLGQTAVRDLASGRMQAEFSVSQLSWIEVRDQGGALLLAENLAAGARRTVTGMPPLAVVVGNAVGVTLTVNGRAVRLNPNPSTNVARVTLE